VNRAKKSIVYLIYHEIELPSRALCDDEPGYVRYIVKLRDFESHMQWLKMQSWRAMSVSQALSWDQHAVALTFDDGCETDLLTAAPILKNAGFDATFYITVGFLGKRGYLSHRQVRELSDLGFEIGSHSMTHAYLSDLADQALQDELVRSKNELQEMTGHAVAHLSCPGGRWSQRVAKFAQQAGYRSVATSRSTANYANSDVFRLGRVGVMRGTDLDTFQQFCQGRGLWKRQARELTRAAAKNIFGNSRYDRIRALLLKLSQ
jgi:peptidoglycan/xylan/chitin deacetylase (PgdA/CDA1 family)